MTPLARRIVAVVVGTLLLAVVVLVLSVSPGPTARAGLIVLGAGLVVVGVITGVMLRWFRKELQETNRTSAVEVMSDAGVDPEDLAEDPGDDGAPSRPETGLGEGASDRPESLRGADRRELSDRRETTDRPGDASGEE